jgi:hypothetical protein
VGSVLFIRAWGEPAPPPGVRLAVRWLAREAAIAIADPGLAGALRKLWPKGTVS